MSLEQLSFRSRGAAAILLFFSVVYLAVYLRSPGMWGAPSAVGLDAFGALKSSAVDDGELWRLVAAPLLHANLAHLLINLANLYVLTVLMVYFFGWLRMLVVFQASSLGGTVLSWAIGTDRSVGASGALFGMLGVLVVLGWKRRHSLSAEDGEFFRKTLAFWGGLSLLSGFVIPMIDNSAHIGGLSVGLTMGMILNVLPKWRQQ